MLPVVHPQAQDPPRLGDRGAELGGPEVVALAVKQVARLIQRVRLQQPVQGGKAGLPVPSATST